jgi:hypothetical protein
LNCRLLLLLLPATIQNSREGERGRETVFRGFGIGL